MTLCDIYPTLIVLILHINEPVSLYILLTSLPSLSDLEKFISVADAGLSQRVEEGDYGGLVGVMGHLQAMKERQNTTDAMFEPLQQTIALLKVYEQELPDVVYKQLEVRTNVQSLHSLCAHTYSCFFQLRRSRFTFSLCLPIARLCSALFLLAIHHLSLLPAFISFSSSPSPYIFLSVYL